MSKEKPLAKVRPYLYHEACLCGFCLKRPDGASVEEAEKFRSDHPRVTLLKHLKLNEKVHFAIFTKLRKCYQDFQQPISFLRGFPYIDYFVREYYVNFFVVEGGRQLTTREVSMLIRNQIRNDCLEEDEISFDDI